VYAVLSLSATTGVQGTWAREQSHSLKRQHLAVVPHGFYHRVALSFIGSGSKKWGHRGETAAPDKRRQLRGIGGDGVDGLSHSNASPATTFPVAIAAGPGQKKGPPLWKMAAPAPHTPNTNAYLTRRSRESSRLLSRQAGITEDGVRLIRKPRR
jgi:hypothetical protein